MRKGDSEVMQAWDNHRPARNRTGSFWTDGNDLYSYDTRLLRYRDNGDESTVVFNKTKYSKTTSAKQNVILAFLQQRMSNAYEHLIRLDNIPRGGAFVFGN